MPARCEKVPGFLRRSFCGHNEIRSGFEPSGPRPNGPALNVILGAGPVTMPGWVATDSAVLDVTSSRAWKRLFTPNSIDRLMAEHLFEHLSEPNVLDRVHGMLSVPEARRPA